MPPFRTGDQRKKEAIPTRHRPQTAVPEAADERRQDWVPTDASGAGLALTINEAKFVRLGRLVFAFFNITYPVTASGAVAKIGGLPFTPRPASAILHPVVLGQVTAAVTRSYVHPTEGSIRFYNAGGVVDQTNNGMSATTIQGCTIYETDA